MRLMALRYAGNCVACGVRIEQRTEAWYDPSVKTVTCTTCRPVDAQLIVGVATEPPAPATPTSAPAPAPMRSARTDLEKGKLTLPLIIHLARPSGEERERAIAAIRARDGAALISELARAGSLVAARQRAEALVASARRELVHVPAGPARDALDAAAMAIVHRDF